MGKRPSVLKNVLFVLLNLNGFLGLSPSDAFPTQTLIHESARRRAPVKSETQLRGENLDKGFNLLEIASGVVPQGKIVGTVKETWKFGWKRMMAELAPQDKTGRYTRPTYNFQGKIGTPTFPDEPGRYHLFVGNPCPVSINIVFSQDFLNYCLS